MPVLASLALALAACTARVPPVSSGVSNAIPPRLSASMAVMRDLEALRAYGAEPAVLSFEVDFAHEQLVVLQAPTRYTRSHIAVRSVDVSHEVASIDACVRGSIVQTLSAPWVAIAVPRGVREVRWTCGDEVQATATSTGRARSAAAGDRR